MNMLARRVVQMKEDLNYLSYELGLDVNNEPIEHFYPIYADFVEELRKRSAIEGDCHEYRRSAEINRYIRGLFGRIKYMVSPTTQLEGPSRKSNNIPNRHGKGDS